MEVVLTTSSRLIFAIFSFDSNLTHLYKEVSYRGGTVALFFCPCTLRVRPWLRSIFSIQSIQRIFKRCESKSGVKGVMALWPRFLSHKKSLMLQTGFLHFTQNFIDDKMPEDKTDAIYSIKQDEN